MGAIAQKHNGNSQGLGGSKSSKRNAAHVCSFFVRGECNRGNTCPYRHSNITEQDLESMQKGNGSIDDKIRERYHGINDPLAKKIMQKIEERQKIPEPPADETITTLFVGCLVEQDYNRLQQKLTQSFEKYGKISRVKVVSKQNCAFVCFADRSKAEEAFKQTYDQHFMDDKKTKILWAKSQLVSQENENKKKKNQPVEITELESEVVEKTRKRAAKDSNEYSSILKPSGLLKK